MTGPAEEQRIAVRPAHPAEASVLSAIAREAKASWGYPPEWMAAWADDLRISPDDVDRGGVFVADRDGSPVGVVALTVGDHGPEIAHLWVRPRAHGQGVGRALVVCALDHARRRGWASLRVESDPHALEFYRALGGRLVGERPAPMGGVERVLPVLEFPLVARNH